MRRFYVVTKDLHLYFGLFISPFVLLFAVSVFFLVHAWIVVRKNNFQTLEPMFANSSQTISDVWYS